MRLSHSRRAAEVGAAGASCGGCYTCLLPCTPSRPWWNRCLSRQAPQKHADLSCVASAPASSVASAAMPPLALYWPPDLLLLAVDGIHQTLGLPWWAAIAASTLLARAAAAAGDPARSCRYACSRCARPSTCCRSGCRRRPARGRRARTALLAARRLAVCVLLLPAIQLPLFTSFFGLRRLADHFPAAHDG